MKRTAAGNQTTLGYVAFLRGINLGPHKQIKMSDLRAMFESIGFQSVKTLLNSGNVMFEARQGSRAALVKKIEAELKRRFGHEISVIVRTVPEIKALVDSEPFKKVKVTPQIRLYVTLLAETPGPTIPIPYESPEKDFKILSVRDGAVLSVVTVTPNRGTIDAMAILEKVFGKKITTRNWNTIVRVLGK